MAFASTSTEFAMLDARRTSGAFVLPPSSSIPGRILNIKDPYGAFTNSTITVYTAPGDLFEDGTNFRVLNNAFDQMQLYAASTTRWYVTGGTEQNITTTNIAVVSTVQTFNWPSLCNNPNFGYGSTFNPTAVGRISLLDNIFTSSTAALASTFIEMGNLNAQPFGMNPGGTFRWLAGVEQNPSATVGLDFKLKQWNSFGMIGSPLFYGANTSTLQDLTTWTALQRLIHRGIVDIRPGIENTSTTILLQALSNGNAWTNARINFQTYHGTGGLVQVNNQIESCYEANGALSNVGFSFRRDNGGPLLRLDFSQRRVGIESNTPSYTFDVNGPSRTGMPVSSITGVSANIGLNGFGIYYYITNSGFSNLQLPTVDPSFSGWFVTLRNNTGNFLSVTITGTASKIPASPFSIPPLNSVSLAYDASPPSGGCNWVYF